MTRSRDLLDQAQQVRAAGRRGQGRHPDPADPLRAPGHLPDPRRRHRPGRRDVLRGRPGSLRRHACSTPGCWWSAASCAGPATSGVSLRATGCWELPVLAALWQRAGIEAVREQMAVVPEGFGGGRRGGRRSRARPSRRSSRPVMATRRPSASRRRAGWPLHGRRHGPAPGAGALQRLRDVPLLRHQAGRRGHQGRRPQAVAPQPRERGMSRALGLSRMSAGERRSSARTAVVWEALERALEHPAATTSRALASSTSAAAPAVSRSGWPSSATGSPWSTPAPTPWPRWRAGPARSASRSPGVQGDLADLPTLVDRRSPTWCSATACSRWSTTRPPPWPRSARCSAPAAPSRSWSPSGTPRSSRAPWPATSRRRSRSWPTRPTRPPAAPATGSPRTRPTALLAGAGFEVASTHGVRVFADLVPGSLLDLEPGATAALVELERAVSERAEYLPLATQLHLLATAESGCSGGLRPSDVGSRDSSASAGLGPPACEQAGPDERCHHPDPPRRHGRLLRVGRHARPARAAETCR